MRVSDLDILIVPGLGGSGPNHWQSRWAQKLSTARMVVQDDWLNPSRDAWVARILHEIEASTRPVAIVGHSLGSLAAAQAIAEVTPSRIAAAFLVAPPESDSPFPTRSTPFQRKSAPEGAPGSRRDCRKPQRSFR